MRSTPKALLQHLAAEIFKWGRHKPKTWGEAEAEAQAVIDALPTVEPVKPVRAHPLVKWVADEFLVSWERAYAALLGTGGVDPVPTARLTPGTNGAEYGFADGAFGVLDPNSYFDTTVNLLYGADLTGALTLSFGLSGDVQPNGYTLIDVWVEGFGTQRFTWQAGSLRYGATSVGFAEYLRDNQGVSLGFDMRQGTIFGRRVNIIAMEAGASGSRVGFRAGQYGQLQGTENVRTFDWNPTTNRVRLITSTLEVQDVFSSIEINGVTLLSADAQYGQPLNQQTRWRWTADLGLVDGEVYPVDVVP